MRQNSPIPIIVIAFFLLCSTAHTQILHATHHGNSSLSAPVYSLIERISPGASLHFSILIDTAASGHFFELGQTPDGRISISADSPVNAAAGLNWYLKYYAGIHLSWYLFRNDGQRAPNTVTT